MSFYYVSDLHLINATDKKTKLFVKFLREVPKDDDILVLGGDIFDLFVGNKEPFIEEFKEVLDAIKSLGRDKIRVVYIEGNHDFHLKNVLPQNEHFIVDDKNFQVRYNDFRIYIEHGDLINKEDYGYLFLRILFRSLPFRVLLFLLPGFVVRKIGEWSSKKSRKYTDGINEKNNRTEHTRKLFCEFAEDLIADGIDLVLLGHSHLADHLQLEAKNGAKGTYINLGYSSSNIPYLRLDGETREGTEFRIEKYS